MILERILNWLGKSLRGVWQAIRGMFTIKGFLKGLALSLIHI